MARRLWIGELILANAGQTPWVGLQSDTPQA